MENGQQQDVQPADEHSGTWVVASLGVSRYIGKVVEIDGKGIKTFSDVKKAMFNANYVTLNPALDYFAPLRQVPTEQRHPNGAPVMAMTRDPIVTTFDFAQRPCPLHLPAGTAYVFYEELHEKDLPLYQSFITSALANTRDRIAAMEAQAAGQANPAAGGRVALAGPQELEAILGGKSNGRRP